MSIEINDELKQRYVEIIRNIWPTMAFVQSLNSGATHWKKSRAVPYHSRA